MVLLFLLLQKLRIYISHVIWEKTIFLAAVASWDKPTYTHAGTCTDTYRYTHTSRVLPKINVAGNSG